MDDNKVLIETLNAVRNGGELVDWHAKYLDLLKRVREAVKENDKDNAAARMFITWGGARSVFMSHVPELEEE